MTGSDFAQRLRPRRIFRVLSSLWVALPCAALLLTSVWYVRQQTGSVIGEMLSPRLWGRCNYRYSPEAYIFPAPDGGVRIITQFDPEYRSDLPWNDVVAIAQISDRRFASGLYAPTRKQHDVVIRIDAIGNTVSATDLGMLRRRLYEGYRSNVAAWNTEEAKLLPDARAIDRSISHVLWWGYAHNIAAALLILPIAVFVKHAATWISSKRMANRLRIAAANQRCVRCDYSLEGLRSPICPECGTKTTSPPLS